jgi:hypothetical protein
MTAAPELIDRFLPRYHFRERHKLALSKIPAALLEMTLLPQVTDDPWVQRLIRIRELPARLLPVLGRRSALKDRAPFSISNFTLLGYNTDVEIAFGLVGRFWRLDYGLVSIADATTFEAFAVPGTPKLVLNFRLDRHAGGGGELTTETRVFCNDRASILRFLPYWILIRPVSGWMRRRLLERIRDVALVKSME